MFSKNKIVPSKTKTFTKTLQELDQLANSEFIRGKKFDDFSVSDLKKLKFNDFRHLCKKKIEEFSDRYFKKVEKLPNEKVFRFEQSEVKNLT